MTGMRQLLPIDVIVSALAGQAERLCAELLWDGKREGQEWVAPSRWGGSGRSLSVRLRGTKAGVWRDFATSDKGGDALTLVAELACGGDVRRALPWARSWLGMDGADAALAAQTQARAAATRVRQEAEASADEDQRRRAAVAMWLNARPILDTPADAYLRARGIDLRRLARPPAALRFHPALYCAEVKTGLPAMVAAIGDGAGQHVATHRTYLAELPDGDGVLAWGKAPLHNSKLTLGSYAGGFIRLSRGASLRPWRETKGDETIAVAEGIETALSVAVLVPEWRVCAAVSISNMARISFQKSIRDVVVCADNDAPNSPAVVALKKSLDHFLHCGLTVRLARPPPGVKDWNDALRLEEQER